MISIVLQKHGYHFNYAGKRYADIEHLYADLLLDGNESQLDNCIGQFAHLETKFNRLPRDIKIDLAEETVTYRRSGDIYSYTLDDLKTCKIPNYVKQVVINTFKRQEEQFNKLREKVYGIV